MTTVPQTRYTAQHTLAFDAALRDARAQLPRTADTTRADRGLVLALNQAVTLESDTIALVRSAQSFVTRPWSLAQDEGHWTKDTTSEVVYRVHSRGGCDCPDSTRRREQQPEAAPGQTACKHHLAAILTAMATLTLAIKGYQPEADVVRYPAVARGESGCTWSGYALETPDSGWWFDFGDGLGGFYTSVLDLELWNREPVHAIAWREAVRSWERWLSAR